MTSVVISSDAEDLLSEVLSILSILCRDTVAVSLVTRSKGTIGALLASHNGEILIYEGWDESIGLPSGEPKAIDISEIVEILVY